MGVDGPGWHVDIVKKLNVVAKRYPPFAGGPDVFLAAKNADDTSITPTIDQVLVVPAGYDDVFRGRVKAFQKDTQAIVEFAKANAIALPSSIIDVLEWFKTAGDEEKNFFWTHVVDVIMYRFFTLVAKPVRIAVMEAVAKVLERKNVDVSIMAHSLGTSVTHDAMSLLATIENDPRYAVLQPPGVRFVNAFMMANVSRELERHLDGDFDVYQSPWAPPSVRGSGAYPFTFYNFRHMMDPFPMPRRFTPPWAAASDFVSFDRLLPISQFNVHDWSHYLDNPEVHVTVINALWGWDVITPEVSKPVIETYKVAPVPLCKPGMELWMAAHARIAAQLEGDPSIAQLIKAGAQFFAAVKAAEKLCDVLPAALGGGGAGGNA
jgi:hypothetical protein